MTTHRLDDHRCPCCNKLLDAATNADGQVHAPRPGDITVCIGCAEILEFDKNTQLQPIDQSTIVAMDKDSFDTIVNIRKRVVQMIDQQGRDDE